MCNILSVNNLNYKDILHDVNLELTNKSFNIIIGANNSGKTTLVKCLAGVNKYNGVVDMPQNVKVGVIMDCDQLIDGTVVFNITYPLINLGIKESESKIIAYELLKKFDLEYLSFKNVSELSTIEKKMISYLFIFSYNPSLIIIDDNLDCLPFIFKDKLIKYLKKISKNSTILFITNNSEYLELANNIFIMYNGTIIKSGNVKDILEDEKTLKLANINKPFLYELCEKLILYGLIDNKYGNISDLVMNLWK